MFVQNVVVGFVAAGLGMLLLAGAAFDGPWLMRLARPRMLAATLGKPAARVVLGLIGAGLIALGAAVALGWRVNW